MVSFYKNQFRPPSKNLSSIIRGFKIGVNKYARIIPSDFQWHPQFYDPIIRKRKILPKNITIHLKQSEKMQAEKFNASL